MTEQSIGDLANDIVDKWDWWQRALAKPNKIGTESLPVSDGNLQQGYFRVRPKNGEWEPVAIWQDDAGNWIAYRNGQEVQHPEDIWTWACRNPISHEAYERAMSGEGWADDPPKAPGIGHNAAEADPFDALKIEYLGEKELVEDFLRQPIKTQDDADRAAIWAKRLTTIASKADDHHGVQKRPIIDAGRKVDDQWRDLREAPRDLARKLKDHQKAFLTKLKREEEERARKAREEADLKRRQAEEAEVAAQQASTKEQLQEAERERQAANAAAIAAEKDAKERRVSAGRTGAKNSLRTERVARVLDYKQCAVHLAETKNQDLVELIDRLAQRAAKSKLAFPGMTIEEVDVVR